MSFASLRAEARRQRRIANVSSAVLLAAAFVFTFAGFQTYVTLATSGFIAALAWVAVMPVAVLVALAAKVVNHNANEKRRKGALSFF